MKGVPNLIDESPPLRERLGRIGIGNLKLGTQNGQHPPVSQVEALRISIRWRGAHEFVWRKKTRSNVEKDTATETTSPSRPLPEEEEIHVCVF